MSTFLETQQSILKVQRAKTITADYLSQNFFDSQSEGIPEAHEVIPPALLVANLIDSMQKFHEETEGAYELGQIL